MESFKRTTFTDKPERKYQFTPNNKRKWKHPIRTRNAKNKQFGQTTSQDTPTHNNNNWDQKQAASTVECRNMLSWEAKTRILTIICDKNCSQP